MKKSILHLRIAIILILLVFNKIITAQIVGTTGYIIGSHVEIGVDGTGGFEGASGAAPVGTHFRGGFGLNGFVANPQLDSWANYNGDFFTPGSPENGWGLQVGGVNYSNNCVGEFAINGSLTNYTHILDCYNLDWEGTALLGSNVIKTKINYFLQENDLFYTTTIVLTNNSTTTIPLMYYYRNVDPDNNESISFDFDTHNTIEDQAGGPSGCQLACVSGSQVSVPGVSSDSYLAFAAVGADYRVSYGGFSNRSASDIWNGTGGLTGTVGSTNFADEAISLAFKIQNFLPGTSRTIKFVTILNSSDKNRALANLLYLTYPGSTFYPPSVCSNVIDTVKVCGGSSYIQVEGPNVLDYNWSWSPTTFLSSPLTYSTLVSPTTTVVYTVTGTPASTVCVSPIPLTYTIAVKPYPPMGFSITPGDSVKTCVGVAVSFTASGGTNYSWTGPGGFTGSTGAVVITPTTVISSGVYVAMATNTLTGCSASGTIHVTVYPNPLITAASSTICSGQTATLLATGADTYTWSPGSALGNPVTVTPTVTTTYSVGGTYTISGCKSTKTSTVTVIPNAIASFTGLTSGQTFLVGDMLNITNTSTNFTSYNWTLCDGSSSTASTVAIPLTEVDECCIKLVATNGMCKDSLSKCYNVIPKYSLYIPNVFTPNGDNVNDVFRITALGIKDDAKVAIYNRWGTKLYEWTGLSGGWDGNTKSGQAPSGTYFLIINYTKIDGGEAKTDKGFFTLFRD